MANYHLYHVSYLASLFKGLKANGVDINGIQKKCQLRKFNLENENAYLPMSVFYEFVETVKESQKMDSIASEFYSGFDLEEFQEYGDHLKSSANLLEMLQKGIKYDYLSQTNGKLQLQSQGALSYFSMHHFDPPSKGREISEKIELMMMIRSFQEFLGRHWIPQAIHLTTKETVWIEKYMPTSLIHLYTNRPVMMLVFKTQELATQNKNAVTASSLQNKPLENPVDVFKTVLQSLKPGRIPHLDDLELFFKVSKKTIERSIKKEGLSFRNLLESHLFTKSLHYLDNHQVNLNDVSSMLGYANTPNFIRAFKKWTNTTPNQYRKQNLHL